ncbi:MAG: hypothetical protein ACKO48_00755 [Actinomycetota bacterium]
MNDDSQQVAAPLSAHEQNQLARQTLDATSWLASGDARALAVKLVRRYSLPMDAEDLLSEAAIRVQEGMSRRSSPLVGQDVETVAIRYASRSVSNLAIDLSRRRTSEDNKAIELARTLPDRVAPEQHVEASVFIEQLVGSINELMRSGVPCPGCQKEIVFAAATEVMQLVLVEGATHDGENRDDAWFDDAIVNVIDRMSTGVSLKTEARRKRRFRCKQCVMELLQAGLLNIGYQRG